MKSADNEIAEGVGRVRREPDLKTDLPDLGVRILTDFGRIVACGMISRKSSSA